MLLATGLVGNLLMAGATIELVMWSGITAYSRGVCFYSCVVLVLEVWFRG